MKFAFARQSRFLTSWVRGTLVTVVNIISYTAVIASAERPAVPIAPSAAQSKSKIEVCPIPEAGDIEIEKILTSNKEARDKALDMSLLTKRLTGEPQVNASRHLANITDDSEYACIVDILLEPKTDTEVLKVLFADLTSRKKELQWPLLLSILKSPRHPQQQAAKKILTTCAKADFGTDYEAWHQWMTAELQK